MSGARVCDIRPKRHTRDEGEEAESLKLVGR